MMSLSNAKRFLQNADLDQNLQAQLNNVAWNIEPIVVIAADRGFSFTANDLQNAIDELWGSLSEEDLFNAAGGGAGNGKLPPGNGIVDNGDGTWSPPPGDQGNHSCFFTWHK